MESGGLLDFFTLEAGGCIERLDGLLNAAGEGAPEFDALLSDARTLRGSATMARQSPIADVASGIERVARGLREDRLTWDAALRGVLIAAIDDLRILVRNVRSWGADDDARAASRRQELDRLAPASPRRSGEALSPAASTGFLANEIAYVAVAIDSADGPGGTRALLDVLPRVRALRGMAALRDVPPTGDALAAIEDAIAPLETGAAAPNTPASAVLGAAAAFLRRAASDLRRGGQPDPNSDEARRFSDVLEAGIGAADAPAVIVPVASLFHDDDGPHVVSAAPNPPTHSSDRFRLEVVSLAEHLERVANDALNAAGGPGRMRAIRAVAGAVASLRATAESFGEHEVTRFLQRYDATSMDAGALRALAEAASLLSDPAGDPATLAAKLDELKPDGLDAAIGAGLSPTAAPTPTSVPVTEARLSGVFGGGDRPNRGSGLRELLKSGLAGFSSLHREPLATPVVIEDDLPAIEEFVYSGRAALDRARELRDGWRTRSAPPAADELEELYDLLDLATAE